MNQDSSLGDNQGCAPQIHEKPVDNQFSNQLDYPQDNFYSHDNNISQQYPVGIKSLSSPFISELIRYGFIFLTKPSCKYSKNLS